jgi:hypothetical protein
VRLACLDDKFAPVALPDGDRYRAPEVTVTEAVLDYLNEAFECLAELRSA